MVNFPHKRANKQMKEKILLDIDGVIADFYRGFAKHLNIRLKANLDLKKEPDDYSIYMWDPNLKMSAIDRQVSIWVNNNGYKEMPIYKGATTFVKILQDNYDVFIVTARIGGFTMSLSKKLKEKIKDDTYFWLDRHNISSKNLFFEHKKIDFCKKNEISLIIEDKLETIIDGSNNNINTILVNRGWNKSIQEHSLNANRAHNYKEILNFSKEMFG